MLLQVCNRAIKHTNNTDNEQLMACFHCMMLHVRNRAPKQRQVRTILSLHDAACVSHRVPQHTDSTTCVNNHTSIAFVIHKQRTPGCTHTHTPSSDSMMLGPCCREEHNLLASNPSTQAWELCEQEHHFLPARGTYYATNMAEQMLAHPPLNLALLSLGASASLHPLEAKLFLALFMSSWMPLWVSFSALLFCSVCMVFCLLCCSSLLLCLFKCISVCLLNWLGMLWKACCVSNFRLTHSWNFHLFLWMPICAMYWCGWKLYAGKYMHMSLDYWEIGHPIYIHIYGDLSCCDPPFGLITILFRYSCIRVLSLQVPSHPILIIPSGTICYFRCARAVVQCWWQT